MIIDDTNLQHNLNYLAQSKKPLRLASKSIRVPELLLQIAQRKEYGKRIMCYSIREAHFLLQQDATLDILIAYPHVGASDLLCIQEMVAKFDDKVCFMIDCVEHVQQVEQACASTRKQARLCIDLDASLRVGSFLHIGVYRSGVRNVQDMLRIVACIKQCKHVVLVGAMMYEAQIAGLGEQSPHDWFIVRWIKQLLKQVSIPLVHYKRSEFISNLRLHCDLEFVNGGGSGSLLSTTQDPFVTEVTVGSAIFQSHLFDYYASVSTRAALFIALRIVRIPEPGIYTCYAGVPLVASGSHSPDKQPQLVYPSDAQVTTNEAFGEVQTPIRTNHTLAMHDLVFARPAKSGEIAELFDHYMLVQQDQMVHRYPTYRGMGKRF